MSLEEEKNDITVFNYQKKLLLKEIDIIQERISNYDNLSFKIKGWAITLWSAICVWGAQELRADIVIIGIFVVLVFWILDGYFKFYQRRSMVRMGYIEDFLNNRWDYEKEGLKEAFKNGSFGEFVIYDPIGRQNKEKSVSFKIYYKFKTALHRNFLVSNLFYLYSSLMFIGILILMFLLLEIFLAIIISIGLFVVLFLSRIIYESIEEGLKSRFKKYYKESIVALENANAVYIENFGEIALSFAKISGEKIIDLLKHKFVKMRAYIGIDTMSDDIIINSEYINCRDFTREFNGKGGKSMAKFRHKQIFSEKGVLNQQFIQDIKNKISKMNLLH